MKKKLVALGLVIAGVFAMAQTCEILGATIVVIDDEVWYSAEIKNESNADILNHRVAVGFIEGQGLATSLNIDMDGDEEGTLCLRSLQAGASNYFSANSELEEDDVDTAVSRLLGPLTIGEVSDADMTFSNIEVTRNDETLVVTGRVRNNSNDELDDVRVCIVVRNEDGDVTRVDVDNNVFDGLGEDENADFSITTTVPDSTDDVDMVDVHVDAINTDDDDKVTEPFADNDNEVEVCSSAPTNTPVTNTATPSNTPTATTTPVTNTPAPTNTPDDAC
jgi:hypothetical protein